MDADVAAELRAIACRARRNVPYRRDPERFRTEKFCIVQDLKVLARTLKSRVFYVTAADAGDDWRRKC